MKALADLVISGLELLEAEARDLRQGTFRLTVSMLMLIVAAFLAASGCALLAVAFFIFLHNRAGPIAAASICGAVLIIVAGGIVWQAQRMIK